MGPYNTVSFSSKCPIRLLVNTTAKGLMINIRNHNYTCQIDSPLYIEYYKLLKNPETILLATRRYNTVYNIIALVHNGLHMQGSVNIQQSFLQVIKITAAHSFVQISKGARRCPFSGLTALLNYTFPESQTSVQ